MAHRRPIWFAASGICIGLSVFTYSRNGPSAHWNSSVSPSFEPPPVVAEVPQTSRREVPQPPPAESPATAPEDPNPEPAPEAEPETASAVSDIETTTAIKPVPPATVSSPVDSSWGVLGKAATSTLAVQPPLPPKIGSCIQQGTGDRVIEARGQTVRIVCTGSNLDRVRSIALVDSFNNPYRQMRAQLLSAEADRLLFDLTAPTLYLPSPSITFSDGHPPQRTGLVFQGLRRLPQQAAAPRQTVPSQDGRTPMQRGMDILEPLFRPHPRQ